MKQLYVLFLLILSFSSHAQWSKDSLSAARVGIPIAGFSQKILFGCSSGNSWDLFDTRTRAHTTGALSFSRTDIAFTRNGNKAYFAGGKYGSFADPLYVKNVDVYDASTNTWSLLNLSLARIVGGAGAVGNKVLFAGGQGRDFGGPVYIYNRVDIFDAGTGARTTAKLSKARLNIATGSAANKIAFAGGWFWDINYNQVQSNVVDIYDNNTGVWSKALLSNRREGIGVAVTGNKILFAGGYSYVNGFTVYRNVDVYDAAGNTWSTTYLSVPRYDMAIAVVASKVYFAGGYGTSNSIDVYDAANNTWSLITMPLSLKSYSAAVIGNSIYYAGGLDSANRLSDAVQVLNTSTNTWRIDRLSQPRASVSSAGYNNTAFFAGGYKDPYPGTLSNRIDFYSQPKLNNLISASVKIEKNTISISVFPNPAQDFIKLSGKGFTEGKKEIVIADIQGNVVLHKNILGADVNEQFLISSLKPGTYFCKIFCNQQVYTTTFIKE